MLVYGQPGAGKTVFAGSADAVPQLRPVLVIDIEGGTFSLREQYPDVKVLRVETWAQMQEVYNDLYTGNHPYQTIVLDSLTEIQKLCMYDVMKYRIAKSDKDLDPDIPDMQAWGKNIELIRKFVRAFRDLPVNTIFTALSMVNKDSKTGSTSTKPSMSGKLADEVAGFVDIVTYLYTIKQGDELTRCMLTASTDQYVAKDRSAKLDPVIVNPTMATVYGAIFNTDDSKDKK